MKKLAILFGLVLFNAIQMSGMQQKPSELVVTIEGLDKRSAQAIFDSLIRLSNAFGKEYDPHASQGKNSS